MLFGLLIVVDFLVMFLSSSDDTPADTPAPHRPFSQLALLDQQLRILGPSLGREVQTASVRMSSSSSKSGTRGKSRSGKFIFG